MKEKLLVLIGRIGKEARVGKIPTKVNYINIDYKLHVLRYFKLTCKLVYG